MERIDFADLVAKNRRWTWVLLGASFLLLAVVSLTVSIYLGGGLVGVIAGVAVAMALTFASYAGSDKIALSATHAREADPNQFGQLHNLVEQMAIAAGIPKPKVYVVHDPAPNAFATGKSPRSASVAVTTGLLEKMNRDELEGVLAHELAHIRNYDIRVMTVAVATAGSVAVITDVFWRLMFFGAIGGRRRGNDNDRGGNPLALIALVVVAIFAPIAAALLKAAISRKREALADASAVAFTRYPTGLRRALEKLDADSTVIQHVSHATSHLWIESPDDRETDKSSAKFNEMFNTHPPLRERINILRAIEGLPAYEGPEADVLADLERRRQQRLTDPTAGAASAVATAVRPIDTGPTAASTMHLEQIGLYQPDATHEPDAMQSGGQPSSAMPSAPAGWYVDPSGQPHTLRYWDGGEWTKHTRAPMSGCRRHLRTIAPVVIVLSLLVASCGSYDRNPEAAQASTTTRRGSTPTASGSTTTTTLAPGASTSSTRPSSSTTQPNSSTSTASTTRPPLNPAGALPPQRGRLAILDAQGRLVVTQPNGTGVVPVTNASQGEIAHPTWSPDGSRLVWSATSPVGAQVASTTVGSTAGAVALPLTEPAPTYFAWRPPPARTVLGLPTTTIAPASLARVAWSRSTASNTADTTENNAEDSTDFGVLDLAAAATLRTLASGSSLYFWLSPDGTRAIVHNGDADLAVIDLDTGVSTSLEVAAAGFETPVWLEGNSVLLAVQAGANRFLSVVDVSTARRQDLLRYEGTIQFVVDPSGQRIAYQVNSGGGGGNNPAMAPRLQAPTTTIPTATIGRLSVYERRNNSTRSILDSAALAFAWSPTSDRIAFLAQASGGTVQWRFWTERTIESSVLFQPSPAALQYIAAFTQYDQSTRWFSPDGKAFVFAGRVADLDGVWVQVLDGFGPPARVSGGTLAVWSPQ